MRFNRVRTDSYDEFAAFARSGQPRLLRAAYLGTATDTPRWTPTATSLPNGDVLIVGGYDDRIRLYADAQLISASVIAG